MLQQPMPALVVLCKRGKDVGVLAVPEERMHLRRAGWLVCFSAKERVRIVSKSRRSGVRYAEFEIPPKGELPAESLAPLRARVRAHLRQLQTPRERASWHAVLREQDSERFLDSVGDHATRERDDRQSILEAFDLNSRLAYVTRLMDALIEQTAAERRKALVWQEREVRKLKPARVWNISELLVWKKFLRGVGSAPTPGGQNGRTNPTLAGEILLVSAWSPGPVIALDKAGRSVWRRVIPGFADEAAVVDGRWVLVASSHTVHLLELQNGRSLWSYCPYGTKGEWIYSAPVASEGRVFFGDRNGLFQCLDLLTGKMLWWIQPGRREDKIHSTALIHGGLVIAASNDRQLFAVTPDGELVWKQPIDGPCTHEIRLFCGHVLVETSESVSLHRVGDGVRTHEWRFPGRKIETCAVADDMVVIRVRDEVVAVNLERQLWTQKAAPYSQFYHWNSETRLIYESRIDGLGILDPQTGKRLHEFSPGSSVSMSPPPCVADGVMYVLNDDGYVLALRHPLR